MSDIVEVTESGGVTTATLTRECVACRGTGLYAGEGERDGAAVVCHNCKGEGQEVVSVSGVAFTGRRQRDVKRVYLYNPGICIGEGEALTLRDFGGIPYSEWLGLSYPTEFPQYTEMRGFACPFLWTGQDAAVEKCCGCNDVMTAGCSIFKCPRFSDKAVCWGLYDAMTTEEPAE